MRVILPLFAYCTLVDAAFTANLLDRPVRAEPARLIDFELLRLEEFPYPTVFHAPGATVDGRLYRGLTDSDYERLDAYEGVGEGLYQRIEAYVVASGAAFEPAFLYAVTEKTLRRHGIV